MQGESKRYYVAIDNNYNVIGAGKTERMAMQDAVRDGEYKPSDLAVHECSEELFNGLMTPGWSDYNEWIITTDGFMDVI